DQLRQNTLCLVWKIESETTHGGPGRTSWHAGNGGRESLVWGPANARHGPPAERLAPPLPACRYIFEPPRKDWRFQALQPIHAGQRRRCAILADVRVPSARVQPP